MPTNCTELYNFATQLESNCTLTTEQIPRTTAHKAYYYAYHFLKDAFPDADTHKDLQNHGVHKRLIEGLKKESSKHPEKKHQLLFIASQLESLKAYRTKADYRLELDFLPQQAQEAILKAGRIVQKYNDHFST